MEAPEIKCAFSTVSPDTVILPREEYNMLVRSRFGIDAIAASHSKYGFDSDVIYSVMKTLGFDLKEES